MQNSFTTMATPGLDVLGQALLARKYGFQGIDFRVGEPGRGEISENLTQKQAEEILEITRGLEISSLLCYNKTVSAGAEAMAASVSQCLKIAQKLRCAFIRIFTGRIQNDQDMDTLLGVLTEAIAQDGSNVRIGLQVHKNNGISVAQGLEICQKLPDPRVGVILSPDQSLLAAESYERYLPALARRVFQVYIADVDAEGAFTLIGDGIIDFAKELGILVENGFDGYITMKWEKCWYPELPDYTQAFPSFFRYYYDKILPLKK